jgi:hypothetical protein
MNAIPSIIIQTKMDEYLKPLEEDNLFSFIRCIAEYIRQTLILNIFKKM